VADEAGGSLPPYNMVSTCPIIANRYTACRFMYLHDLIGKWSQYDIIITIQSPDKAQGKYLPT
jgi:hypothetical protein